MRKATALLAVLATFFAFTVAMHAQPGVGSRDQASTANKVDLNSASEQELESLPGVGAATAKKIIAGRPYSSPEDVSKAGVSAATIKKITPLVTFGGAAARAPTTAAKTKSAAPASSSASSTPRAKVDLNNASAAELKDLPGIGDATAKKIISGRPYSSVNDLSKSGVSSATIGKISSFVTVGSAGSAASVPPSSPSSASKSPVVAAASVPTPVPSVAPAKQSPAPATQGIPGNGMVWVNTDSGVYHKEGSRYYGKTKNGKYMTEADAMKAGYHAAKNSQ